MTAEPTVKEIMATELRTIDRNQTLDVAEELTASSHIRHLPVVEGARVVGVLSQRDLFQAALARTLGYGSNGRKRVLRTIAVKEVMSEPAVTVEASTAIREAARLMVSRKIGCLPVVDRDALVGLVTEGDVVRHAYGI
jgi:CBS domain-containing membrane protein